MKINLQIEQEMLTNPDFQAALKQLCWELSRPKKTWLVALHETAHLVYFEPLIQKMPSGTPSLELIGPTIDYNYLTKKFEFTLASVQTPFIECGLTYNDEILEYLALGCVGGGVFLSEIEHISEPGDDWDKTVFDLHFSLARGQRFAPKHSKVQIWTNAKSTICDHLKNEQFKNLVLERAARVQKECFPFPEPKKL